MIKVQAHSDSSCLWDIYTRWFTLKNRVPGSLKVCALGKASCFPDEQGVGWHEGVRAGHARPLDRPA